MPRRHVYEAIVDVDPESLFAAITDIRRWPEWDAEIARIEQDGTLPRPGSRFALTPKGGPRVAMTVEAVERPKLFADVAHLPLARMRTVHEFERADGGTRVRVTIETTGPLAFLWDRMIAKKQAAGAADQTRRFVTFARAR